MLALARSSVADYAALKAANPAGHTTAVVRGRASDGDGGGGTFWFDPTDRSADVTADPQSGLFVAPSSDPTGASGAWVRRHDGRVNAEAFGILTDGNDHGAAMNDAHHTCYLYSVEIHYGDSQYHHSATITLADSGFVAYGKGDDRTLWLYTGTGYAVNVTAADRTGLDGITVKDGGSGTHGVVFNYNAATTAFMHVLRNFGIQGFSSHGLWLRNDEFAQIVQGYVFGAGGNGVQIDNTAHTGGVKGISNYLRQVRAISNGGSGFNIANQQLLVGKLLEALQNGTTPQVQLQSTALGCDISVDVENQSNGSVGSGVGVSGNRHKVYVNAYSLATGAYVSNATDCDVDMAYDTSVTSPVVVQTSTTSGIRTRGIGGVIHWPQSAAPSSPLDGMEATSDGTGGGFDGSSGAGRYRYDGGSSSWKFLG